MSKLELYIDVDSAPESNFQRLELFKDEEITITQSIKNNKDISKVFTDYTQDFNIPASKNNKRVLRFVDNSDIVGGINIGKKLKGEIRFNGETFKKGYLVLRDVSMKMGLAHSYKLYFVGGLGKLKTALGDTKISDLDFSELGVSVVQDFDSVKSGLAIGRSSLRAGYSDTTNPDSFESMLYSTIMTEGGYYYSENFTVPDRTEEPKNLAYRNSSGTATTLVAGLKYTDLKPSIRMNSVIRAIENNSLFFAEGKAINFSNDFFNDTSNKEWFDLFMLMHNKKGSVKISENSGKKIISGFQIDSPEDFADTDGINIAFTYKALNDLSIINGEIVTTKNSSSNITAIANKARKITYTFTPLGLGNDDINYEIFVATSFQAGAVESLHSGSGVQVKEVDNPPPTFTSDNGVEGFLYRFYATAEEPITIGVNLVIEYSVGSLSVEFDAEITLGDEQSIDYQTLLPKIKVSDFLKGAFNMFNLIGYEDADGTIVIQSYNDYMSTGKTVNITDYVDNTSLNMSLKMLYNSIDLSYKESEFINYSTRSPETVGLAASSQAVSGDSSIPFSTKKVDSSIESADTSFKNELPFQLMEYSRLKHSTTELDTTKNEFDLSTNIQIGELVDADNKGLDAKGLIYYPIKVIQDSNTADVNGGLAINNGSNIVNELTSFNIPSNTLYLHNEFIEDSEGLCLSFGSMMSAWSRRVVRSGLYNEYHYDYIQPYFLTSNRRISITAMLPLYLLKTINLNDILIYKNKEYRINSLKTNLQTGKTSLELEGFEVREKQTIKGAVVGYPSIALVGSDEVTVEYNSTYTDLGATASDPEDGDITADITDDSNLIDTQVLGEQTVIYSVDDSDGNTAQAQRTVCVEDTATPNISSFTSSVNQTTKVATLDFTVASTGIGIKKVELFVKLDNTSYSTSPTSTRLTNPTASFTDSFSYTGVSGNTYKAKIIAYNTANSVESSEETLVFI